MLLLRRAIHVSVELVLSGRMTGIKKPPRGRFLMEHI